MNGKKLNKYKVIQILLVLLFIVGIVVIGIYPFSNRNLSVHLLTDSDDVIYNMSKDDITSGAYHNLEIPDDVTALTGMRIYSEHEGILLRIISYSEFLSYIEATANGSIELSGTSLVVNNNSSMVVGMKPEFQEVLEGISSSYLQERVILCGLYLCLIIIGLILVNAAKERQEDNWNNHGPIQETKMFIADMKKYWQYMVYAANADLKAEVANSYLNRLWWLLEPFFNMLVYVIVFGRVMGNNIQNYSTFTFSALLMWNFFSKTINYSVKLVRNNRDIISKVYVPKFVILISNMILNLIKLGFSLLVLIVMMIVFRVQVGFNLFWVIPAYLVIILISFGAGMIFLHFGVYVDDLSYAVGILLSMLMFLSGTFYEVMNTLPHPLNALMMCLNPVALCNDTMRNALLCNRASNLPILGMWFILSILLCYIGVHIVYKNENSYVKIV